MASADDVRAIALSLDDVEEIDSEGFDFRVTSSRQSLEAYRRMAHSAYFNPANP